MKISFPFPRNRGATSDQPQTTRHRNRSIRLVAVVAGLVIVLAGGLLYWRSQAAPTAATLSVPVTRGDLTVNVESSGSVEAAQSLDLPFQTDGQVRELLVRPGERVRAGQVLARLDDRDLQLEVANAQASLESAQAKLAQARQGNATPEELAAAQASVANAQAQVDKARTGNTTAADIASAEAELRSAQAKLDALKNPASDDLSAAQLKVTQAQNDLDSTRTSASATKTNAELAMHQAADNLTKAQANYATAKANWDYVKETGADPTNPETTDASGKTRKNKLNDVQKRQYYETYVQAEAAMHSAEKELTQAQVTYDKARQDEIVQIQQAEANLAGAMQQLDALKNPSANDLRALTPLKWQHINPYGTFTLNMQERLPLQHTA